MFSRSVVICLQIHTDQHRHSRHVVFCVGCVNVPSWTRKASFNCTAHTNGMVTLVLCRNRRHILQTVKGQHFCAVENTPELHISRSSSVSVLNFWDFHILLLLFEYFLSRVPDIYRASEEAGYYWL